MAEGAAGVEIAAMVVDIATTPSEVFYDGRMWKTCRNENFVHPVKKYPLDRESDGKSEYFELSTFQQPVWKTMWKVWKASVDVKFDRKSKNRALLSILHNRCQKRISTNGNFRV